MIDFNMSVAISIAIVTRNRPLSLERTLMSVCSQSCQPHEVIISDDSDDKYSSAVSRISAHYGCKLIKGPKRGLYANRNSSIAACTGTHIRTMDDDHTFPDNHFYTIKSHVESDPKSIFTIGEIAAPSLNPLSSCESISFPGQLHPGGFACLPSNLDDYHGISCGGTVYPRQIFESGIKNSECFLFGSSYLEYGSLLKYLGFTIKLVSDTYLIHHETPSPYRKPDIEIPAMMFAVLCHSFLYFPKWHNKLSTLSFLSKTKLKLLASSAWHSYWGQAYRAFVSRRDQISQFKS